MIQISTRRAKDLVTSSLPWDKGSDLPDVLGFGDLRYSPALTAAAINARQDPLLRVGTPTPFQFPKPNGGTRYLTHLDAITKLDFKRAAQLAQPQIEAELDRASNEVHYARSERAGDSWSIIDWRRAHAIKRSFIAQIERDQDGAGRGELDVKNHYPSTRPQSLVRMLSSFGVDDSARNSLLEILELFDSFPGSPPGLPVGPEASALLGTASLIHLDRLLARSGAINFCRWVDDFVIVVDSEADFAEIAERCEAQLTLQGQGCNYDKTHFANWGTPLALEQSGGAELAGDPSESLEELILAGSMRKVPSALGLARKQQDIAVIEVLVKYPAIIETFPRQVAEYLRSVRHEDACVDYLEDIVLNDRHSTPSTLHACRVYRMVPKGPTSAARAFERAMAAKDHMGKLPLAAELFAVANTGDAKHGRARLRSLEVASLNSSLCVKRGAIGTLTPGAFSSSHEKLLKMLATRDRAVGPVVARALSA